MNKKVYEASQKIKSKLSRRERNRLIDKYGDELYNRRRENKDVVINDIMAREKRALGPISYFLFSFLISYFLSKLFDSII